MEDKKYIIQTYRKKFTTKEGRKFYKYYGVYNGHHYLLGFKKSVFETLEKDFPAGLVEMILLENDYFIKREQYTDKNGNNKERVTLIILNYQNAKAYNLVKQTLDNENALRDKLSNIEISGV